MKMTDPIIQATDDGKNFYLLFTITEFDSIPILNALRKDKRTKIIATFDYDTGKFTQENIWNNVVNNAKLVVQDGHNLVQILSCLNDAVGTVKAAIM